MENITWWKINLGEDDVINHVNNCIKNKSYSMGSFTKKFEKELSEITGFKYVIFTTSGSTALLMASIAAEITKDDIVCVPNRTWIATAHAPHILGAKILLVDTEFDRPIIDTEVLKKLTHKPKAIYPVSLNGNYANIKSIKNILPESVVIEDCAQALFSYKNRKHMGSEADMACFFLGMAKFLPVGQGGFIGTNNINYAKKLKLIRTHGVDSTDERTPFMTNGFNFRPSDISSCVGLSQLNKLQKRKKSFINIWKKYRDFLDKYKNIKLTPVNIENGELPIYVEVISPYRDFIVEKLSLYGINTRKVYPDLDTAKYIKFIKPYELNSSRIFGEQSFVLPCGPSRTNEEMEFILKKLQIILDSID